MADKEARLRLLLQAQNEASPAFTAMSEAIKSIQTVAQDAARAVTESLRSISSQAGETAKSMQSSSGEEQTALRDTASIARDAAQSIQGSMREVQAGMNDAERATQEDTRIMREAFTSLEEGISAAVMSIRRQTTEVTNAINQYGTAAPAANRKVRETSLGALIAIQMLGESMKHLGEAGAHLFEYAIEQGTDFQQSIKNIQVVIAANSDAHESWNQKMRDAAVLAQQLQDKALQLGSRGAQSANEIAAAMDTLLRSGVDAKAVLGGAAEAAQNVSIVTGDSLDETAALITEIYHQFREEFAKNGKSIQENMKETGDVISGVLLSARIDTTDFLNTLKYVGPVASQLGSSLGDAAVATAVLAQNGIKGSQAGTSLRRALTNLLEPTKSGTKALEELGIIVNGHNKLIDEHTGKLKTLTEIQEILHKSMVGLTDAKKAQLTHDIFGQYAFTANIVLANQNSEAYQRLKEKIEGLNSTQAAASMLDTFNGHMRQLQAHVATTAKEFGMAFLPVLEKLIPIGNAILNWLQHLSPQVKELLMGALALGSGIAVAGGALAGFAITMKFASEGAAALKALFGIAPEVRVLGTAFRFLLGPWGLLIAGIVTGVTLIITHWKQIVNFVQQHFGISIPGVLHSLGKVFTDVWNGIRNAITAVWNFVGPYIINGVKAVADYWKSIWPELRQVFEFVWKVIKTEFETYIQAIKLILSPALGFIKGAWHDTWHALLDILKMIWDAITGVIKTAWDTVSGLFKVALDLLTGHWGKAWKDMKSTLGNVWKDIKGLFSNFVNDAIQFGKDFIMGIVHGIEGMVGNVVNAVKNVWNSITSIFGGGGGSSAPSTNSVASDAAKSLTKNLPHMATGGVVSSPTLAMIGEGGEKEYVIPESKLTGLVGSVQPLPTTMSVPRAQQGAGAMFTGPITIQINGANKDGNALVQEIIQTLRRQTSYALT